MSLPLLYSFILGNYGATWKGFKLQFKENIQVYESIEIWRHDQELTQAIWQSGEIIFSSKLKLCYE